MDESPVCGFDSSETGPRRALGSAGEERGNSGEEAHGVLATRNPWMMYLLPGVRPSRKEERRR
ncbi:MAG: hypothetical protein ACK56F_08280, partial [bacterium]